MLIAVYNGNGSMAQFSHPEFSGSGQWMRGGMTMVSDLFNNQLKYRVDNLCNDIANELANYQQTPFGGSFQSQSQSGMHSQSQAAGAIGSSNSLFAPDPTANWWPSHLGAPSALGSQDNIRYAYFPLSRRLAVNTGGQIWIYDTLEHQIGGFSQQQGSNDGIAFSSQFGTIRLSTLPVISRDGVEVKTTDQKLDPSMPTFGNSSSPNDVDSNAAFHQEGSLQVSESSRPAETGSPSVGQSAVATSQMANPASGSLSRQEILDTLDQLGGLLKKGYLTEEEFTSKKADLLSRL
jgi:hypothetical protein